LEITNNADWVGKQVKIFIKTGSEKITLTFYLSDEKAFNNRVIEFEKELTRAKASAEPFFVIVIIMLSFGVLYVWGHLLAILLPPAKTR
jgi:hypothetical protein